MADFSIERSLLQKDFRRIAGVDEVGRGCLFGPVVAAAVVFSPVWIEEEAPAWLFEVDDSKLLRPGKREVLARSILGEAWSVGVGSASSEEVDRMNIHRASLTAMRRALAGLSGEPDIVLVDGFELKGVHYPQLRVKQGDRRSLTIAAASVLAKVLRDGMMTSLDQMFEGLGLARHKGYGTREHFRKLAERGSTPLHRRSFHLGLGEKKA